ncbi:telomeric repeat-binding factor 2-like [Anneissia japonica]|uniref:telomeric repeat-binding factor 2-like n=1 Tax=Anneissia japonica TaxID=1529436 RepID=UPI00142563AE|nr:telomeric repeat-binding factor 2-like [Anneissia japonica]
MSSSSSESGYDRTTNIYTWLLEFMCYELHNEFLESSTVDSTSDRDYLKGFIQRLAPKIPLPSIKMCMVQYLHLLVRLVDGPSISLEYTSEQCSDQGGENSPITPLEDAIQILDKIEFYDKNSHIPKNDINEFKELLRTEAVFVCCRANNFEKGKQVLERQWPEDSIETEIDKMTKDKLLEIVDSKRCKHVEIRKSSYADFIAKTHHYLQAIYSIFSEPFLVAADRKFKGIFNKRRRDETEADLTMESVEDVPPTPNRSAQKMPSGRPRKELRSSPRNEQPKENENCNQKMDENEGDLTVESAEDVPPTPNKSAQKMPGGRPRGRPRRKLRSSPRNEQSNENENCNQKRMDENEGDLTVESAEDVPPTPNKSAQKMPGGSPRKKLRSSPRNEHPKENEKCNQKRMDENEGDLTVDSAEDVPPSPNKSAQNTPRKTPSGRPKGRPRKNLRSPRNEQPKENEKCNQKSGDRFKKFLQHEGKDPEKFMMDISRESIEAVVAAKVKQYVKVQSGPKEQGNSCCSSDSEVFAHLQGQNASPTGSSSSEIPHTSTDETWCPLSSEIPHTSTDETTLSSEIPHTSTDEITLSSEIPHTSTDEITLLSGFNSDSTETFTYSLQKSTDQQRPLPSESPQNLKETHTSSSPQKSTDQQRPLRANHRRTRISLKFNNCDENDGEIVKWDSDDEEITYPVLPTPKCRYSLDVKQGIRRRWTNAEVEELRSGVRRFGVGEWSKIRDHFHLEHRSAVDIKDKWRNLYKNK